MGYLSSIFDHIEALQEDRVLELICECVRLLISDFFSGGTGQASSDHIEALQKDRIAELICEGMHVCSLCCFS